jgi:DNA polymerase III epsilon subunit-like protein
MFVIFDTETTGFGEADVVELASIMILDNGKRFEFRKLMKPEFPIHPKAEEIHGISNEQVANLQSSREVVIGWLEHVKAIALENKEREIVFGAHNLPFDLKIISRHVSIENEKKLCSLKLAKSLQLKAPDNKLGTLYEYFKFTERYNAHSALDDCLMTEKVMFKLFEQAGRNYYEEADNQG